MEGINDKKVIFAGHLEEHNDLKKWERDAPLDMDIPGNKEALSKIIDALAQKIKTSNRKAVLFISSSKLRSQQTSELIAKELKQNLGDDIKFRFNTESDLDGNDQGQFIIPDEYVAGEVFEGLKLAGKIYLSEFSVNKNLNYRFGDPFLLENGEYKYPELLQFFSKSGESYKEPLIRIFNSVLEMSRKAEKLEQNTEIVIVAHGLTYHILQGMTIVAEDFLKDGSIFQKGELPFKIWDEYLKRTVELKDTAYGFIDISNLGNPELIKILQEEIDYLKDN
jgi:broad specificity phosphatase PhoE